MLTTLALLSALIGAGPSEEAPQGRLVVVGGGRVGESIRRRALELAGGPSARILIVPHASSYPASVQVASREWLEVGATTVDVLALDDPQAARATIEAADLIWFRGGSQVRLMESLVEAGVVDAIRDRFNRGAVVGGTSAGAAVMSRIMIAGPAGRRGTPEGNLARLGDGLGLWPDVIVDQHFLKRRRMPRLVGVVRQNAELLGIGIDEATAVVVSGREFEVVGESEVVVIDARKLKAVLEEAGAADHEPLTVTLKPGMRFDLDRGPILVQAPEEPKPSVVEEMAVTSEPSAPEAEAEDSRRP